MRIRRRKGLAGASGGFDDFEEICYKYDETGRISEKLFPEEMRTRWNYDERGQLAEILHEDRHGVLDRYQYEYDSMGNKTVIIKDRRGLREESGRYEYGYDAMNRLNYAEEEQTGGMAENLIRTDYSYDNRGNLIREEIGGTLIHGYEYGAMNRLSKSWNDKG